MRTPLLYTVLLLAFVAGAWLLWGDRESAVRDEDLTIDPAAAPASAVRAPLRTRPTSLVGVWGRGDGAPSGEVDFAALDRREIKLRLVDGRLTGKDVLDALTEQFGRDLPIRFPRTQDLARFKSVDLAEVGLGPDGNDIGEVVVNLPEVMHLPEVLEVVRLMGFRASQRSSFLMLLPLDHEPAKVPPGGRPSSGR